MERMWRTNCDVLRGLLVRAGVDPADVRAVACCGHGKGLYLWGRDGKPVRAGIVSMDNRAAEYARRWEEDGTAAKAFCLQLPAGAGLSAVALLAWLRDNEPENYRNIRWVFECKDYVRFRLTGEAFAEVTDYSGTNLMNRIRGTTIRGCSDFSGWRRLPAHCRPCGFRRMSAAGLPKRQPRSRA